MAINKAPLLSLGASGALGKTVIQQNWKGLKIQKSYVKPANPKTPKQVTRRTNFEEAVFYWKIGLQNVPSQEAWRRSASVDRRRLSGFNLAVGNMVIKLDQQLLPSFLKDWATTSVDSIVVNAFDVPNFANGSESGLFLLYQGDVPTSMRKVAEVAITPPNDLNYFSLDVVSGQRFYFDVRKDGLSRSGIFDIVFP